MGHKLQEIQQSYKLNTHKSQILSYNFTANADLQSRFDFKLEFPAIKYPGVLNSKKHLQNESNYGPVSKTIKADVDFLLYGETDFFLKTMI